MKRHTSIALSADALLGKSKVYIRRALQRKAAKNLDEYQLWASLALELLGKARLSEIHPCLIADPQHSNSLFAAAGVSLSTDTKTITAKTLFERLKHVTPHIDDRVSKFCVEIAQRRNAELHSGDTPFKTMKLDAWEAEYWYASSLILKAQSLELDDWLGSDAANAPKTIVKLARTAKADAAKERVQAAKAAFSKLPKAECKKALAEAAKREYFHYSDLLKVESDHDWSTPCPSCGGKAFCAGIQIDQSVIETTSDEHGMWEEVETTYATEEFACPVCKLRLGGTIELAAAGIDEWKIETSAREMDYEPDYGND